MTPALKTDIPASQGCFQSEPATNRRSDDEQARMRTLAAEPVVPLNVQLHQRLSRSGGAKASTLKSAMASLERLRMARGAH